MKILSNTIFFKEYRKTVNECVDGRCLPLRGARLFANSEGRAVAESVAHTTLAIKAVVTLLFDMGHSLLTRGKSSPRYHLIADAGKHLASTVGAILFFIANLFPSFVSPRLSMQLRNTLVGETAIRPEFRGAPEKATAACTLSEGEEVRMNCKQTWEDSLFGPLNARLSNDPRQAQLEKFYQVRKSLFDLDLMLALADVGVTTVNLQKLLFVSREFPLPDGQNRDRDTLDNLRNAWRPYLKEGSFSYKLSLEALKNADDFPSLRKKLDFYMKKETEGMHTQYKGAVTGLLPESV